MEFQLQNINGPSKALKHEDDMVKLGVWKDDLTSRSVLH